MPRRRTGWRHTERPHPVVRGGSPGGTFRVRLRVVIDVIAAVIALMTSASGRVALAQAVDASPEVRWERLANPGGQGIVPLAAAPEWPVGGLLLGRQLDPRVTPGMLSRSGDGGATWERLPSPPFQVIEPGGPTQFVIGSAGAAHVLFALSPGALFRSADDGTSWEPVLELPSVRFPNPSLVLSPAFARDGHGYVLLAGRLWQTLDAGAMWQEQEPAAGQLVQQVVFSPDFERDRTLFLLATTITFPTLYVLPAEAYDPHHVDSLGVLRSTDGGTNWQQTVDGLEIEGEPYRQVQTLAVSPTFAQDGTVFVYAQGPWITPEDRPGRYKLAAVFRSRDRGTSWEVVDPITQSTHIPSLVLSPQFAQDGAAILSLGTYGVSPAGETCRVYSTQNAGDDWTLTLPGQPYQSCGPQLFATIGDTVLAFVRTYDNGAAPWWVSRDDGQTWVRFRPPGSIFQVSEPTFLAIARDRLLTVDYQGQLWAYGLYLPCQVQPVLGFGRLWTQDGGVHESLACAVAPERPVAVRLRGGREGTHDYQDYWPEDDTVTNWVRVYEDGGASWFYAKVRDPWDQPPEATVQGSLQTFWGGLMLFVPRGDGRGTIITSGHVEHAFED